MTGTTGHPTARAGGKQHRAGRIPGSEQITTPKTMRTHAEHSRTLTGAHNAPRAAHSAATVSETLKSEVSAYCRSGALDPFPCTIIAMEQVASRYKLTARQAQRLFVELA